MAVQGMGLAMRLRALSPRMSLNETHPKVLYFGMTGQPYVFGQPMVNWLVAQLNPLGGAAVTNEHEWDALISAWVTLRGMNGTLLQDLMAHAQNLLLPAGPVNYYWP
jgi:hypothetical protein